MRLAWNSENANRLACKTAPETRLKSISIIFVRPSEGKGSCRAKQNALAGFHDGSAQRAELPVLFRHGSFTCASPGGAPERITFRHKSTTGSAATGRL